MRCVPVFCAIARSMEWFMLAAAFAAAPGLCSAATVPVAGATYVYRIVNAYNRETRGQAFYRVDNVAADRTTMEVTTDPAALGPAHTEIYDREGNWLKHPLVNHDQPVEYEFSPAYPAYEFPLDVGKSWSVRVPAVNPATGQHVSVRVDGEVLGSERVTVPAGSFDAIKVRRNTYAGDWDGFRQETHIVETEWYAPALGRAVRLDSNSAYWDLNRCDSMGPCDPMRGDWNILELVEIRGPK